MEKTHSFVYTEDLRKSILSGKLGPKPNELTVTGASYIYQTTQFPSSSTKYHNYYLLVRVESYFGACAHNLEQLDMNIAAELSGLPLDVALLDKRLPVQIATMDAYLGLVFPHDKHCSKIEMIPGGPPLQKAKKRDQVIAKMANVKEKQNVALIGVVNPLVEAIKSQGATCLPCDYQLKETEWGEPVEQNMEVVLEKADNVICTAMTLSNGTFDRILEVVREKNIPLTVYAQTGSAIIAQFLNNGVTSLVAEPFPFTQFSGSTSQLYCYSTL